MQGLRGFIKKNLSMNQTDRFSFSAASSRRDILLGSGACLAVGLINPCAIARAAVAFSSSRLRVATAAAKGRSKGDVLLIPGLASGPELWASLSPRLSAYRLHLVHIAGFSKLAPGENASGPLIEPIVNELARYIREQQLRRPFVVGHSMGGILGLMLGLRNDINLAKLMVVDMLPEGSAMLGGTSEGFGYLADQLNGYFTGTKTGRQMLSQIVQQTLGGRNSDPRVVSQSLAELARINLTPRLPTLRCPLTVIYASPSDRNAAASQAATYMAAYRSAKGAIVKGIGPSGHVVMADQPAQFADAVMQFLG
jgi:pimeloyl-ACP methyl ester carboxylesterase